MKTFTRKSDSSQPAAETAVTPLNRDTSKSAVARKDQELTSNPASCGSPAFASAAAGRPMPVYEKPFR